MTINSSRLISSVLNNFNRNADTFFPAFKSKGKRRRRKRNGEELSPVGSVLWGCVLIPEPTSIAKECNALIS
jgi:hypothetical protein